MGSSRLKSVSLFLSDLLSHQLCVVVIQPHSDAGVSSLVIL